MRTRWRLGPTLLALFPTVAGSVEAQSTKWWAVAILDGGDSKNCGATKYAKFEVEMTDGLLKTRTPSGTPYTFRLQAPLNPDGSGRVIGLSEKNRPLTFTFDPGAGPRLV